MIYFTLRRHKKLTDKEDADYLSFYDELNDKNKKRVLQRGKLVRLVASVATIFLSAMFLIFFIVTILAKLHWFIPFMMVVFTLYFGYESYCTLTWYKIEDYEFIRLVDMYWVQTLINDQKEISIDYDDVN